MARRQLFGSVAAPQSRGEPKTALIFSGVVVQKNQIKMYKNGRRSFFVRLACFDGRERLAMFAEKHNTAFRAGDVVACNARSHLDDEGTTWLSVNSDHSVENHGPAAVIEEIRVFNCEYIGLSMDRWGRARGSMGRVGGDWCLVLPEKVMKDYFARRHGGGGGYIHVGAHTEEAGEPVDVGPGFYGVLGVPAGVDGALIKKAYRVKARMYHPDTSDLPKAIAEVRFQAIQEAYDCLGDGRRRRKYDAACQLAGVSDGDSMSHEQVAASGEGKLSERFGWMPPHRYGLIKVRVRVLGNRYDAMEIVSWQVVRRERTYTVPAKSIQFFDWGIEAKIPTGEIEAANAVLPFQARGAMNGLRKGGHMTLRVKELKVVVPFRWKVDSPGSTPRTSWEPDTVVSVLLDDQMRTIMAGWFKT